MLQKQKVIIITTAAVIFVALCVFGILHLNQANEWLRFLQGRSIITEHEKTERQPNQSTQPQEVTPSNRNPNQKPTVDLPAQPHEIPEEYPGNQDLDDYGNWLSPYEQPEREQSPVYRNEAITIPIE